MSISCLTLPLLQIFDALNLASISMIPAHTGQLAAIQFNPTGTRIATASDKGTVIRVFNVADGARVYELRRYVTHMLNIFNRLSSMEVSVTLYLRIDVRCETQNLFDMSTLNSCGYNVTFFFAFPYVEA